MITFGHPHPAKAAVRPPPGLVSVEVGTPAKPSAHLDSPPKPQLHPITPVKPQSLLARVRRKLKE